MMILVFSLIWSMGGNIQDTLMKQNQAKFSKAIRSKILNLYGQFPFEQSVFDFYISWQHKEFLPWSNLIAPFSYSEQCGFGSMTV